MLLLKTMFQNQKNVQKDLQVMRYMYLQLFLNTKYNSFEMKR